MEEFASLLGTLSTLSEHPRLPQCTLSVPSEHPQNTSAPSAPSALQIKRLIMDLKAPEDLVKNVREALIESQIITKVNP